MQGNVLLINWRDTLNPEAGGAETYYHEIFKRLVARGLKVTLLCHQFKGAVAQETVDGIRVIRHGSRNLFNYQSIPWLRRNAGKYDLVIEDLNKIPFFTPRFLNVKRLHLVMHFFGGAIFREVFFPFAAYVYLAEKLVGPLYRGERFVAISDSTRQEIERFNHKKPPVAVVEPGIDTSFYYPSAPKSQAPLIVCVTRLKKYKNVQFLIKTFSRIRQAFPTAELAIAGSGEYRKPLEALVRRLGLEGAVRFEGFITEEKKRDLLSRAWLFAIPSVKEGWGICNIEAGLCETAVLASNVAGLRDSVLDGQTGLLFGFNDSDDYVQKAVDLLGNEQRRTTMAQNARAFALGFGWDQMSEKMEHEIQLAMGS